MRVEEEKKIDRRDAEDAERDKKRRDWVQGRRRKAFTAEARRGGRG